MDEGEGVGREGMGGERRKSLENFFLRERIKFHKENKLKRSRKTTFSANKNNNTRGSLSE